MFWKKKKKPRVVCFKIRESLPDIYKQDCDIITKIERAFPPLGALIARFDYEGGMVCATILKEDILMQEMIGTLGNLGLHATLIEEE